MSSREGERVAGCNTTNKMSCLINLDVGLIRTGDKSRSWLIFGLDSGNGVNGTLGETGEKC